eukprot:2504306-Rhodomonas_salina.4
MLLRRAPSRLCLAALSGFDLLHCDPLLRACLQLRRRRRPRIHGLPLHAAPPGCGLPLHVPGGHRYAARQAH